jgi:hypothetical protein
MSRTIVIEEVQGAALQQEPIKSLECESDTQEHILESEPPMSPVVLVNLEDGRVASIGQDDLSREDYKRLGMAFIAMSEGKCESVSCTAQAGNGDCEPKAAEKPKVVIEEGHDAND